MPYQEPDPTDPNVLVGISLPGNEETTRDMAYAFAEEFAQLGFDDESVVNIFRRPDYEAAHRAYVLLGEDEIRSIVAEAQNVFGRFRVVIHDQPEPEALVQIEIGEHRCPK